MTQLRQLQDRFQQAIFTGASGHVATDITDSERAPAGVRLGIYFDAYRIRLVEALVDTYTGTQRLAGASLFNDIAHAYIDAYPSTRPSIRWYGDRLGEFIAQSITYSDRADLAEFATFEWLLLRAFDAPDITPLNEQAMAAVPPDKWGETSFRFHPSLGRVDLKWSVPAYRVAVVSEASDDPEPLEENEYPVPWVIWRPDLEQYFRSMETDEAYLLDAAISGADFAHLCEALCEWIDPEHAPARAVSILKRWLVDGLIIELIHEA